MRWTLVLNKHWTPIDIIDVYDAVTDMCRESASGLSPESYQLFSMDQWIERSALRAEEGLLSDEQIIRTPNFPVEKPEIVILNNFYGIPYTEIPLTRRNLIKRDNYTCQYCGRQFSPERLSIDHVHPRSRGGRTTWENCVTSCFRCNAKKGSKLLEQIGYKLASPPGKPTGHSPLLFNLPGKYPPSWKKFIKP
jgi:hypothetical protein